MRNIQVLYSPDDIHQHFHRRWKTELFKTQHDKNGSFIHEIMSRVARYPMFIYDMSEHPQAGMPVRQMTEWKHFSPWWGGIINYLFEAPGIHDTCWLHDLYHKGYMSYSPGLTLSKFQEKMVHHEMSTTVATVYEIYFHHPELRPHTYGEEILADRYMEDEDFLRAWRKDPGAARAALVQEIQIISEHPQTNPVEQQIYEYNQKNKAWMKIWKSRYNLVETRMHQFQNDIDGGADRKMAMDDLMDWLLSDDISSGSEIPFFKEAIGFAEIYRGGTLS